MEVNVSERDYLQAIIDQSRDFVLAIDIQLRLRSFNSASFALFKSLSGVELHNGECFAESLKPFPDKMNNAQRALNGERFSVCEFWGRNFFVVEYAPLYDASGRKIGACVIGRVMDSMWDEQAYEEVDLSKEDKDFFWPHVMIFGRDRDSQSFPNQVSWEKYTGQNTEEYKGHGWLNAHHPSCRPRLWKIWQAVRSCNKPRAFSILSEIWNTELNMYRHTLIHSTPQYDRQGNLSCWNSAGIDIHELRQMQADLEFTTARLKMILEAGKIGTWDMDLTKNEVKMDKKMAALWGLEEGTCDAEKLFEILVDRNPVEVAIKNCAEKGVPYDCEFQIRRPDGSLHWIGARGESFRTKDGRHFMLGVNWDITMRKQMEEERVRFLKHEEEIRSSKQAEEFERKRAEEAEENQRRQEEFIDTVCHEIRNPLVGIYGGVHMATEELLSVLKLSGVETRVATSLERIRGLLDSILKCAEQQKIIVDDVLDFSKLQNNRIELVPVPFQLSACFELIVDIFQPRAYQKNLGLHLSLPPTDIIIKADLNRLQQVIINLVSNAIKFTHEGSVSITASVEEEDDDDEQFILLVEVTDTGIGIPADEIPLLFDRFTQAKSHRRFQYGGTGLGLAISKRLVEAMGGKITVESIPGHGATFRFKIKGQKVSDGEMEDLRSNNLTNNYTSSMDEDTSSWTALHILVVDDNSLNQKILASYLEKAGHRVELASDGFEAVQKAAQQHFDIIFMDIEMPNMNGLQATVALRQREQELNIRSAIIGLSGNARKEKIDAALDSGMDFYLTKPYHRDEILRAIAKFSQLGKLGPRVRKLSVGDLHRLSKHQKTS